jgi:hypothetical protein
MSHPIDFEEAVKELLDPQAQVAPGALEIWGGEFPVEDLAEFLAAWKLDSKAMEWRIWEYSDRADFTQAMPVEGALLFLERARVFGQDGDLSLRRDENRFLWHFIGKIAPPAGGEKAPDCGLRKRVCNALLWGECHDGPETPEPRWQEDRVGWADAANRSSSECAESKLKYPHPSAKRLSIEYEEYSAGGQVAFVWWKEIKPNVNRKD